MFNTSAVQNLLYELMGQAVVKLATANNLLFMQVMQSNKDPVRDPEGFRWKAQQDEHEAFSFDRGGAYGADDFVTYLSPYIAWGRYGAVLKMDEETLMTLVERPLLAGAELLNQMVAAIEGIWKKCDTDLRTNDPVAGGSNNANGLAGIPAMFSDSNVYAGVDRTSSAIWQVHQNTTGGAVSKAILDDCFRAIVDENKSHTHVVTSLDIAEDVLALPGVVKADPPRLSAGQALTGNLGSFGMNPIAPVGYYNERPIFAWPGWLAGRVDQFRFDNIRLQERQPLKQGQLQKVQGADAWSVELTWRGQVGYLDPTTAASATGLT